MTLNRSVFAVVLGSLLTAGGYAASSRLQAANAQQETGPVYSIEGAWYGMTDIGGLPSTPTMDTFTSNAQRPGLEGTFLCTIPAGMAVLPSGTQTPSGHGNWTRIGINTYAYTAMRAITVGTNVTGWGKFYGTITAVSANELTGTINAEILDPNQNLVRGPFTGTLERHRVQITFEQ